MNVAHTRLRRLSYAVPLPLDAVRAAVEGGALNAGFGDMVFTADNTYRAVDTTVKTLGYLRGVSVRTTTCRLEADGDSATTVRLDVDVKASGGAGPIKFRFDRGQMRTVTRQLCDASVANLKIVAAQQSLS